MPRKLLTTDEFRAAVKDGARPEGAVLRLATGNPQMVEGADRTVRFVFSDGSVDRSGDTIDPKGWDVADFLKNPVALWAHDSFSPPIGRAANVAPTNGKLMGDIEFMPADVSPFADSIFRMVKGGYINAVSVGFIPLEWEFVNDKDRPYGIDFTKQELLEISLCPVPCNANALAEARAKGIDTAPLREWAEKLLDGDGKIMIPRRLLEETFKAAKTPLGIRRTYLGKAGAADWECGAARDLPIDDSDGWDGPAAEASIFDHAGGEDFDPAKARPGFLLYDASAPKLRGSYKEPFAHAVNGELKAAKGGIRAAASRLPQTDVPQSAKDAARAVIDHYEARMKDGKAMGDGNTPTGNCGRMEEDECGMSDPRECAVHVPTGDCGREEDEDCGMADTGECMTHAPKPAKKSVRIKAGRRISAASRALLEKAVDHHAQATKCIKDVLAEPDPPGDDVADQDGMTNLADDDADPEKQRAKRLLEAKRLKDLLN